MAAMVETLVAQNAALVDLGVVVALEAGKRKYAMDWIPICARLEAPKAALVVSVCKSTAP